MPVPLWADQVFVFHLSNTPLDLITQELAPLWLIFIISPLSEAVRFGVFLMTITCIYSACHPKEHLSTLQAGKHFTSPSTVGTSAEQRGSSWTHCAVGLKGRKFPQPGTRKQKKQLYTWCFLTLRPSAQSYHIRQSRWDTAMQTWVALQTQTTGALVELWLCWKEVFWVSPSGWWQSCDTQIMPLSQVPWSKHRYPAACGELRGGYGTSQTQEGSDVVCRAQEHFWASNVTHFLKGRLLQTSLMSIFFLPAVFSRNPCHRTKPCCAYKRYIHSCQKPSVHKQNSLKDSWLSALLHSPRSGKPELPATNQAPFYCDFL